MLDVEINVELILTYPRRMGLGGGGGLELFK